MKITGIECMELRVPDANVQFDGSYLGCVVKVHTDAGITGIAEGDTHPTMVRAIIDASFVHVGSTGLRAVLIGEDPTDIERIWNLMYDQTFYIGRRGVVIHALSLIDIALWDIRGKLEGKPIAELFGPVKHKKVKAYGTIYPTGFEKDEIRTNIDRGLAKGVRAIKICAHPRWKDAELASFIVRTAREHVGPGIDLMLDAATAWTTAEQVLPVIPALKEAKFAWLEAPLPLDDIDGHAKLAGHGIAIGGGDLGSTTRHDYIDLMDRGKIDICQPDVSMVGGLTELFRLRALARPRGKRIVLHGYKSNLLIATNLAFYASHDRAEPLEYSMSVSPLRWGLVNESLPIDKDGMVETVTGKPGLGVTLNDEIVAKYRVA
jgi:L-rhamnonate dehydratase